MGTLSPAAGGSKGVSFTTIGLQILLEHLLCARPWRASKDLWVKRQKMPILLGRAYGLGDRQDLCKCTSLDECPERRGRERP